MRATVSHTRNVRLAVRVAISFVLFVLFALHVQGALRLEIVERVESYLYDVRVRLSLRPGTDDRIVIVDVDEQSLAAEGQWPWPRAKLARLVDALFDEYEVAMLGFDSYFPEAEETSARRLLASLEAAGVADETLRTALTQLEADLDGDRLFAESLIARDVVLGYIFKDSLAADEPESAGELPAPLLPADAVAGIEIPFVVAQGYVGNLPLLREAALTAGFVDTPLIDADGIYRRAPLVQRYRGDLYASFALSLAQRLLGSPSMTLQFATDDPDARTGLDLEAVRLGDRRIPVDGRAAALIPFRGRQGSFPYVSATRVLDGSAPRELLAGRIAIVGASASGLFDLRSTPVAERYIGVETHANLLAGILDGTVKQKPAYTAGVEVAALFLLGIVTALILPRFAALTSLALLIATVALVAVLNYALFARGGVVVPLASSLSFVLLAGLLQISYGHFVESRNKRRLSGLFGQYVPPELVAEMDEGGREVSLAGESKVMSVLFSDVRGFTTLSERLDARELTQLMNELLTPITRVIHEHRGTIDKYMGDAVMAFWGAPLEDPQHARNAVLAGIEMIATVERLGTQFAARGWPPLHIGVGVATGKMNVGNMGSEFRMAYTVLGDTVNLGSRLEGLTKQYGVDMIVSAATVAAVADVRFRPLDLVRVKGKREPVAIYEPLGRKAELGTQVEDEVRSFEAALTHYREQRWDDAEALLRTLAARSQRDLYEIYLRRIREFRATPPGPDWDGVFAHETK
jgi:adenylate cyclase